MTIEIPIWLVNILTYCGYGVAVILSILGIIFLKMMYDWSSGPI